MTYPHIALHGYARTGKDEVGKILVNSFGYERIALGDLIKRECDESLWRLTGISAYTDIDAEKAIIRPVLVQAGYHLYSYLWPGLLARMDVSTCPMVNTRIFRLCECQDWVARGGVIWEVVRPGVGPAEPKEAEELQAARDAGLIHGVIGNNGSLSDLEWKVAALITHLSQPVHEPT